MKSKYKAASGENCEHCKIIFFVTTLQGNVLKIILLIVGTYFCNQTLSTLMCLLPAYSNDNDRFAERNIITTRPLQTLQKFLTRAYKIVLIREL